MKQPTHLEYLDSIEDPFFQSVAKDLLETKEDAGKKLEDMEVMVRKKVLEMILLGEESSAVGVFWRATLDLCHHVLHYAVLSSTKYVGLAPCRRLPYAILSDCIEALPSLEDIQDFWETNVEPAMEILFDDLFWNPVMDPTGKKIDLPNSHLPFLKVTNQFLKRLEDSSDKTVQVRWKGKILWALARGFSITDKSALKLWGNFHVANQTDFDSKEAFDTQEGTAKTLDYNLYEAFWSLQHDFANPNKLNVADFVKKLRLILSAMESTGTTASATKPSVQTHKYLTSSALLPFQIKDPNFRSTVVAQFLIVASHLGAESPPLKNALSDLLRRAKNILQKDHPHLYQILWESLLSSGRENNWRTWKKEKCPPKAFPKPRKRPKETPRESAKRSRYEFTVVATKSTQNRDIAKEASKEFKNAIPTLEAHLEPYIEALDPEAGIEDEYHPKNDSLFAWRAMRLFAKHQLPLMNQCQQPSDLEKVTRQWYKETHDGTEIPGELPSPTDMEISEEVDNTETEKNDTTEDAPVTDVEMKDATETEPEVIPTESKETQKKEEPASTPKEEKESKDESTPPSTANESSTTNADPVKELQPTENGTDSKSSKEDAGPSNDKSRNPKNLTSQSTPNADPVKEPQPTENGTGSKSSKEDAGPSNNKGRNPKNPTSQSTPNADPVKKPQPTENGTGSKSSKEDAGPSNNMGRNPKNPTSPSKSTTTTTTHARSSNNINFVPPPPRGRRNDAKDGGRNGGRRDREEGPPFRDDNGPQSARRRSEDGPRGRRGGEAPYPNNNSNDNRGRSDGPPPRRGRYDDNYRGDAMNNRGERFGDRGNNRSGGRDNHWNGGDGRPGGREDHRGGDRGGDRNRRMNNDRPRGGGGGGRRRR